MKKLIAYTILLALFLFSPSNAEAMFFSLVDDWSNASNPNGVWSYNQGDSPLLFNLPNWPTGEFGPTQTAWANGNTDVIGFNSFLPGWFKSVGDPNQLSQNPAVKGPYDWVEGDVVVHTSRAPVNGVGNGFANVTWTSPYTGIFDIDGGVWIGRDRGTGNNWALYLDNNLLTSGSVFSGDPYSRSNPNPINLKGIDISQGSELKLEFYRTLGDDFVGVNFNVNTIPEPSTVMLFASGMIGFFVRRKK